MSLLEQLTDNKGTISNALSKQLAKEVLDGDMVLLDESVPLVTYQMDDIKLKKIRIGAACIIDEVAKKEPKLVTRILEELLPALDSTEPQTRWIVLRILGNCATLEPELTKIGIAYAKRFIYEKVKGQLCLVSSADIFLGEYGKLSQEATNEIFPILLDSMDNVIENEHDWIMEACMKIVSFLNDKQKKLVLDFSEDYINHPRKATQTRIKKIKKLCS